MYPLVTWPRGHSYMLKSKYKDHVNKAILPVKADASLTEAGSRSGQPGPAQAGL